MTTMESELTKDTSSALLDTSDGVSEGRQIFALDTPIFYLIGWVCVAYFAVYFITFYAGPMLFGTRPYRPFGPYRRSLEDSSAREIKNIDSESPDFVSRALKAIEGF